MAVMKKFGMINIPVINQLQVEDIDKIKLLELSDIPILRRLQADGV